MPALQLACASINEGSTGALPHVIKASLLTHVM
jgi:hypothetical protein